MLQSDFFFYLIVILVIVVSVALLLLKHAGFFYTLSLRVVQPPVLPRNVAYALKSGPYKNSGQAFNRLSSLVPKTKLFGIYYDDPDKVPQEKLRFVVGSCLPDLPDSAGSNGLEDMLQKNGYQLYSFQSCDKAIVTEYPWRNQLSLLLAYFFVYPAIRKYIKESNVKTGPCIEYYEKDFIRFIVPLDHHEQFYVPGVEPNYQ